MRPPGSSSASREQLLEVDDLGAAVAQQVGERVVLLAGPLDPQHVVEQQVVVVGRGQPLELQVRPVDHDLAQLADLRVDAEGRLRAPGVGELAVVMRVLLVPGSRRDRSMTDCVRASDIGNGSRYINGR